MSKIPENAVFVSNRVYLNECGGGVQWCTRNYLEILRASDLKVTVVPYDVDRRPHVRLRRKLRPRPFENYIDLRIMAEIQAAQEETHARWIFLNNSEPLPLAATIKTAFGNNVSLVYLSHGLETTDQLNDVRLRGGSTLGSHCGAKWLGKLLLSESDQRRYLDGVVCVSQEDVLFERWLGSENPYFLAHPVRSELLDWRPVLGRIGTVATLNHMPNLDGIRRLAAELRDAQHIRFRVIGSPVDEGQKLIKDFPCIDYLGQLGEAELRAEVATWAAFVNPIFCQARGLSTKIATALGWGIPVLTTLQGARGYRWDDSVLARTDSPPELAAVIIRAATGSQIETWREQSASIRNLAPSLEESGNMLQEFLCRLRT